MAEETKPWTYTTDAGVYDVSKFTDEGKTAFLILLETDKDLAVLRKQTAKLNRAIVGFNQDIAEQLTEDMIVDEALQEDLPLESATKEI